ncbi:Loki-CTERM sorting domain-containing protein [Candidatus Lokiarchaeum ossiferum]|uniref:Loki-CTERM sorting domain-containing protein n=1 Tax=Candidatus Lokiarchaeum ossiferum TaxID=2951803 RepID=UPI00352EF64F
MTKKTHTIFAGIVLITILTSLNPNLFALSLVAAPPAIPSDESMTEPNNSWEDAFDLDYSYFSDLEQNDDDWYKLWVPSGRNVSFWLINSTETYVNLKIYNASQILLESATDIGEFEYSWMNPTFDQYLYFYVYGDNDGAVYSIDVWESQPLNPSEQDTEVNNDRNSAFELFFDYYENMEQWDDDWYKVLVKSGDRIAIDIYSMNLSDWMNITVYSETLAIIGQGENGQFSLYFWTNLGPDQYLYIFVNGSNVGDPYTVSIYRDQIKDVETEPNNDQESAFLLKPNNYLDFQQNDDDWYNIWLNPYELIVVTMYYYDISLADSLNISLYEENMVFLKNGSQTGVTKKSLSWTNGDLGQNISFLITGPNFGDYYSLNLWIDEIPLNEDDRFEQNDDYRSVNSLEFNFHADLIQRDEDWYSVSFTPLDVLDVYLLSNFTTNLEIELYNSTFAQLGNYSYENGYKRINWASGSSDQLIYLRVIGENVGESYSIDLWRNLDFEVPEVPSELIYDITGFSFNLSIDYWKFSNITVQQYGATSMSLSSNQFSSWDLSTESWTSEQSTTLLAEKSQKDDIPIMGRWIEGDYYEQMPNLFFFEARSGEDLYHVFSMSPLIQGKYDESLYGEDWLRLWDSTNPTDFIYLKIDTTSGILLEFLSEDLHLLYLEDFGAHQESLYDVSWGVSAGDELVFDIEIDSESFNYTKCKYVVNEIKNETLDFKYPALLFPEPRDSYYFRASSVYATFSYWDENLKIWVEGEDFLGRSSPMIIGSANKEMVFGILDGEEYYPPMVMPENFQFSSLDSDYGDLFSSALKAVSSSDKSLYIELEIIGIMMYYNMTYYENGTLAFYDGRTPLFGSSSFLDFTLRTFKDGEIYVPPASNTTDVTTNDDLSGPFAVPGYPILRVLGFTSIAVLIILKKKRKAKDSKINYV